MPTAIQSISKDVPVLQWEFLCSRLEVVAPALVACMRAIDLDEPAAWWFSLRSSQLCFDQSRPVASAALDLTAPGDLVFAEN